MTRAAIIVIDSLGLGGAPDAADFGDTGADTFGHIAAQRRLAVPNLVRLGLARAARASSGATIHNDTVLAGAHGFARERSAGKDTPSGHWEIAGLPVFEDWGYFPPGEDCFPRGVLDGLITGAGLPGVLGCRHASGTVIIEELGAEHIATGRPICYTSADSVFQIAAHESHFGLDRLYDLCTLAKRILEPLNIGRVIARPFVGERPGDFKRTANRRDYTTPPPAPTLLDHVSEAGGSVVAVGKIADIFAGRGICRTVKAGDTESLIDLTIKELAGAPDGTLIFTNLVDFDTLFGHRRDVEGYAAALEALDRRLPEIEAVLRPGDLAVLTADHGCDPTWPGSDHTRENVPVLVFGPGVEPVDLGGRDTFADIGQTVAEHLDVAPLSHGTSFLRDCRAS